MGMASSGFFSFEQLTSVQSQAEAIASLKQFLTGSGFSQINDWNPGTYQYNLLELCAFCYVAGQQRAQSLALGSIVPTSSGSFLTNIASSFFNVVRNEGQQTQGQVALALTAGKGPFTIPPGQLTVTYNGSYSFTNNSTISLTGLAPSASAIFTCTQLGAASDINVPTAGAGTNSLWTVSPQTYNGINASNPAIAGTQSWVFVHGNDVESDPALQLQCVTQWPTLTTAETLGGRVVNMILSKSNATITQVRIDQTQPAGPGTVTAYCATDTDVAATGDIAEVLPTVQGSFMNGTNRIFLGPAQPLTFGSGGINNVVQVYYSPSLPLINVQAAVSGACIDFISSVTIGGNDYTPAQFNGSSLFADIGELETRLAAVNGVRYVNINNRSNISLNPIQKLVAPSAGFIGSLVVQLTASQY